MPWTVVFAREESEPTVCANVDAVLECALPYLLKFFCGLFYNTQHAFLRRGSKAVGPMS